MSAPTDLKFLIVDDFSTMRRIVRNLLKEAGHPNADEAEDGQAALNKLRGGNFQFVVTDINMPRMDGLSLLQKLQEADDKLSTIIVSAYGDMSNIRTAMNRGAFDFLTKPID